MGKRGRMADITTWLAHQHRHTIREATRAQLGTHTGWLTHPHGLAHALRGICERRGRGGQENKRTEGGQRREDKKEAEKQREAKRSLFCCGYVDGRRRAKIGSHSDESSDSRRPKRQEPAQSSQGPGSSFLYRSFRRWWALVRRALSHEGRRGGFCFFHWFPIGLGKHILGPHVSRSLTTCWSPGRDTVSLTKERGSSVFECGRSERSFVPLGPFSFL
jgi:hypothetical protein